MFGLWAPQRNNYTVIVRPVYSISDVIMSPEESNYTCYSRPDLMVVLSPEGSDKVKQNVEKLLERDTILINASLLLVETRARKVALDLKEKRKKHTSCFMSIAEFLRHTDLYPLEAFKDAIATCEHQNRSQEKVAIYYRDDI